MFNVLFDNTSLPVLQQVLSFSEQRQKVLAHNIANMNTPGFRACDLPVEEFTQALSDAVMQRDGSMPHRFRMQSTRNITFDSNMNVAPATIEVGGLMNYYDGADRSIERLQNEMLKNAMWHEAAAKLYTHQTQLLDTAIRERIR
ncbi:MAG: hypothetical protein HQ546_02765 [Planctomycetes bacterium]|nr:hypothetical protein [Planctomycetota bacterium]